jgi:hypothetical protein
MILITIIYLANSDEIPANELKSKFTAANSDEAEKKKIEERMKQMDKMCGL